MNSRGRARGRGGPPGAGGRGGARSTNSNGHNGQIAADDVDAEIEYLKSKLERLLTTAHYDDTMDARFGFEKFTEGPERVGWCMNMQPTVFKDPERSVVRSGVDFYFLQEDGGRFKATYPYEPYFFLKVRPQQETELEQYLRRKFDGRLAAIEMVAKEDLDLDNHLVGLKQKYMKLVFYNVQDLVHVKSKINPSVRKNQARQEEDVFGGQGFATMSESQAAHGIRTSVMGSKIAPAALRGSRGADDIMEAVLELREYDVPYHMRVSIDKQIAVGKWYNVRVQAASVLIKERPDKLIRPDPVILAWDIETTKLPLKFPNMEIDQIMMISYMIDGRGFLIINREIISADVEDFEYTPKPEFEGPFTVVNEPNEEALIRRFFEHVKDVKPNVMVTYNGDSFDWPFLERRAEILGLNMYREIGFRMDSQNEYKSRFACHMDCFRWVKRDSYLPVGSQGLKAVTRAKLRYDPLEIHYEEICRMAAEKPQELANYSVSDAVATYYLYVKYVHPFIFALCMIIPLGPDDVLRKGSGTLCESLLMFNAYHNNIIMPNKSQQELNKLYKGHLLDSETYVGGHVEALESGVFRSDIPCRFRIDPIRVQKLIDTIDETLHHAITKEEKRDMSTILNYQEQKAKLVERLEHLRDNPNRVEVPLIYHLDVAAMYPNIILTNRLQPSAMVSEQTCAACDFNRPENNCQRKMTWMWRGDISPATRNEFESVRLQLEAEAFPGEAPNDPPRAFHQLIPEEQALRIKKRLADYARKVYKRTKDTVTEEREATVCQRENPFYINTVREFRDRRYVYKGKHKDAKKELDSIEAKGDPAEVKRVANLVVLYDSLQLAHKCILNSFYGYVMRKGARWYSMKMAGIVCHTGAEIITRAREIVEQLGRPLELDTDGIWCALPGSFPENLEFKTSEPGKRAKFALSYPGAMLNIMVQQHFTNDQYQDLVDPKTLEYETQTANSIFFEVDGPYKAMILPASKEKDKRLKKRYAVFNEDGSLAELKGFEIKRNGELKLIKIFQSSVFESFLQGSTLEEVYACVASVADHWLDVLYARGQGMADYELFDLISENRSMSRTLTEYGAQKSTSISTAKRLAEFLGDEMVKDKGLACQFVIACKPEGAPVTERAIPVAIFQADEQTKLHYLRKWTKQPGLQRCDIRDILDWEYYIERLGSAIQKIITIPAAMQKVSNPVPRVRHPDWLHKELVEKADTYKQKLLSHLFKPETAEQRQQRELVDVEDQVRPNRPRAIAAAAAAAGKAASTKKGKKRAAESALAEEEPGDWREILGRPPDEEAPYEEWLAFHKRKWRIQRAERKRLRLLGVSNASTRARGLETTTSTTAVAAETSTTTTATKPVVTTMAAFLRHTANKQSGNTHWQILQLAETSEPGLFRLWCLVAGDLHCMQLNVPRRFYVHSHTEDTSKSWRRVNRFLPRSQPCEFLYEVTMPESEFRDKQKHLIAKLSHTDVEGVYELQLPLVWQALIELGCVAVVRPEVALNRRGRANQRFDLDDLQCRATAECAYLPNETPLERLYLYHSVSQTVVNRGRKDQVVVRAVFGLFSSATQSGHIIVVDPSGAEFPASRIQNIWVETYDKRLRDPASALYLPPQQLSLTVEVSKTVDKAFRNLDRELNRYALGGKHGPTVLIVQSAERIGSLSISMPTINEFPVVTWATNAKNNQYASLSWQVPAVKKLFAYYSMSDYWFYEQVDLARFIHAPVGNIPLDHHVFGADLFFARQLRRQGHLLWASPSTQPDLGGKEDDDNRLMTNTQDTDTMTINNPGVYETVCVEMELENLPVAAVLHSSHVSDKEGVATVAVAMEVTQNNNVDELFSRAGNAMTSFDESAQCLPAFRILRSMVKAWLQDVVRYGSAHSEEQLHHLYRWLKSPESLMYDPALLRMVRGVMKKLFLHLVGEFKKLGSSLVHGAFNRLTLLTEKTSAADGREYMKYILQVISSKELFASLALRPERYWELLVWMDPANYGGVSEEGLRLAKKRKELSVGEAGESVSVSDSASQRAVSGGSLSQRRLKRRYMSTLEVEEDVDMMVVDGNESRLGQAETGTPAMAVVAGPGKDKRRLALDSDDEDGGEDGGEDSIIPQASSQDGGGGGGRGDDGLRGKTQRPRRRPATAGYEEEADADVEETESHLAFSDAGQDAHHPDRTPMADALSTTTAVPKPRLHELRRRNSLTSDLDSVAGTETGTQSGPQFQIELNWNIKKYLPENTCQAAFEQIIAKWIYLNYNARHMARLARGGAGQTPMKNKGMALEQTQQSQKEAQSSARRNISETLMQMVNNIYHKWAAGGGSSMVFPFIAGSHLKMTTPPLEFIKFTCQVLALDRPGSSFASRLKRELLRIIQVKEFAPEAQFEDPCDTFVLSGVICTFCNASHDLDLCRDVQEWQVEGEQGGQQLQWVCHHCDNCFDPAMIEQLLVEVVHQHVMGFQLQDLKCAKCKLVKYGNLARECECSGPFRHTVSFEGFRRRLLTLLHIAKYHKLELLAEEITWTLESCGVNTAAQDLLTVAAGQAETDAGADELMAEEDDRYEEQY